MYCVAPHVDNMNRVPPKQVGGKTQCRHTSCAEGIACGLCLWGAVWRETPAHKGDMNFLLPMSLNNFLAVAQCALLKASVADGIRGEALC